MVRLFSFAGFPHPSTPSRPVHPRRCYPDGVHLFETHDASGRALLRRGSQRSRLSHSTWTRVSSHSMPVVDQSTADFPGTHPSLPTAAAVAEPGHRRRARRHRRRGCLLARSARRRIVHRPATLLGDVGTHRPRAVDRDRRVPGIPAAAANRLAPARQPGCHRRNGRWRSAGVSLFGIALLSRVVLVADAVLLTVGVIGWRASGLLAARASEAAARHRAIEGDLIDRSEELTTIARRRPEPVRLPRAAEEPGVQGPEAEVPRIGVRLPVVAGQPAADDRRLHDRLHVHPADSQREDSCST